MKGLKWFKTLTRKIYHLWRLLFFFLVAFVCSFGLSSNASALNLSEVHQHVIVSGSLGYPDSDNTTVPLVMFNRSGNDVYARLPYNQWPQWTQMHFQLDSAMPAGSIVTFNVTYNIHADSWQGSGRPVKYNGIQFEQNRILLYDSCKELVPGVQYGQNGTEINFSCTYMMYNQNNSSIIDTSYYSHILEIVDTSGSPVNYVTVVAGPVKSLKLTSDGLSASDRQWLSENLPGGANQSQIESAITNAQQSERAEYESEANESLSTLEENSDQLAIDTKMNSLFDVITGFVSVITTPVVSTCILPIHLENFHNFGFYEVDLCRLNPPSGLSTVLNVIFIFFVLGLAVSAIRSVVQMYKEVIDG